MCSVHGNGVVNEGENTHTHTRRHTYKRASGWAAICGFSDGRVRRRLAEVSSSVARPYNYVKLGALAHRWGVGEPCALNGKLPDLELRIADIIIHMKCMRIHL